MKSILQPLIAIAFFCAATISYAGNQAGDESARNYKLSPEEFDGKRINLDVTHVRPILRAEDRVEGVEFFIAHTVDHDNRTVGGSMLVAVLDNDVKNFTRKYGTAIDRNGRGVNANRLRGTFHFFEKGHRVYLDESGEAHELIMETIKTNPRYQLPGTETTLGKPGKKKF